MRTRVILRASVRHEVRYAAFSLIEVLVVISVIALLLALLMPSLSRAREQVRRVLCKTHLRQWGVATQFYREDNNDYLPTEGTYTDPEKPGTWFNTLPPYLDLPPYIEMQGVGTDVPDKAGLDVWICPSKNLTDAFRSESGMNQFHYGMNQVLDGLGSPGRPSRDTPGFLDQGDALHASRFTREPHTVLFFDIAENSPAATPRGVATSYFRSYDGELLGEFHGDYANILYLNGSVGNVTAADLVTDRDNRNGDIIWNNPLLYWGYRPPVDE